MIKELDFLLEFRKIGIFQNFMQKYQIYLDIPSEIFVEICVDKWIQNAATHRQPVEEIEYKMH